MSSSDKHLPEMKTGMKLWNLLTGGGGTKNIDINQGKSNYTIFMVACKL